MNLPRRFFWEDSKTRAKVYVLTVITGFIFALVRAMVFHKPERQVDIELLAFLLISNFVAVLLYSIRRKRSAQLSSRPQVPPQALNRALVYQYNPYAWMDSSLALPTKIPSYIAYGGLLAFVILVSAPRLSVPIVQAAIVNPRLERAASSLEPEKAVSLPSNQLKARFQKIASIADTYRENQVRANPDVVTKAVNNLEETLKAVHPNEDVRRSGVAAFVSLVAYARYNNVLIAVNAPTVLLPHGETGNSLISQVPLKNGSIWWQGSAEGNTIFAMPTPSSEPVFPIIQSNVVFNAVNFNGFGMGRAFVGTDEESQVVVMNATIEGASQKLDSIVWLNIKFKNSRIIYNGGPLYLGDVTFENCQFQFGNDLESQRVLSQIRQVEDKPLTLVSGL